MVDKNYQHTFTRKRGQIYAVLCGYFSQHGRLPTVREAVDVFADAGIHLQRSMIAKHYRALLQLEMLIELNGQLRPAKRFGAAAIPPLCMLKIVDASRGGGSDWHSDGGEMLLDTRLFQMTASANYYGIRFKFRLERPTLTVQAGDVLVIMQNGEDEPLNVSPHGWALAWHQKRYDLWRRSWFEHPSRHLIESVRKAPTSSASDTSVSERSKRHVRCVGSVMGVIRRFPVPGFKPIGQISFRSEPLLPS